MVFLYSDLGNIISKRKSILTRFMPNRVNIIVLVFILLLGKPRKREMQDASSEIMDSDMFLSASCLCIEQSTFVYCNKTLTHDRIHGALS